MKKKKIYIYIYIYYRAIDSDIKRYEEIIKPTTGQGEDYTNGHLLDFVYVKNKKKQPLPLSNIRLVSILIANLGFLVFFTKSNLPRTKDGAYVINLVIKN